MEALREALKTAGLPSDPEQVVGRTFIFTAGEIGHHQGAGNYKVVAASVQAVGTVSGVCLVNKTLTLLVAHLEIDDAVVLRFDWLNSEEEWDATIMWPSCEPNYGRVLGSLKLLEPAPP